MDDQIAGALSILISTAATSLLLIATAVAKWISKKAEKDDADE